MSSPPTPSQPTTPNSKKLFSVSWIRKKTASAKKPVRHERQRSFGMSTTTAAVVDHATPRKRLSGSYGSPGQRGSFEHSPYFSSGSVSSSVRSLSLDVDAEEETMEQSCTRLFLSGVKERLKLQAIMVDCDRIPSQLVALLLMVCEYHVEDAVERYYMQRMEWRGGDVDLFHSAFLEQVMRQSNAGDHVAAGSGGRSGNNGQDSGELGMGDAYGNEGDPIGANTAMDSKHDSNGSASGVNSVTVSPHVRRRSKNSGEISSLAALYSSMPESKKKHMFDVEFEELHPMPPVPYLEPPKLATRQPYWLMHLLLETMLSGGYLFPGLYIPHKVWFQKGAKLPGQQAKITFITALTEQLQFLVKMNLSNADSLIVVLRNFNMRCQKLYDTLSRQLPTKNPKSAQATETHSHDRMDNTERSEEGGDASTGLLHNIDKPLEKKGKNKILAMGKDIYKKTKKNVKKELQKASANRERKIEKQLYIPSLITLFEKSQFIGQWVDKITENNLDERGVVEINDQTQQVVYGEMEKVSFFFMLILRKFILRDLWVLIERYMKKARESTSRLFPKKIKWE